MAAYYYNGERIALGDEVLYGGKSGKIVFLIQEDAFLSGFKADDWSYRKRGIGVRLEDGSLFCLNEPDEDLLPQT